MSNKRRDTKGQPIDKWQEKEDQNDLKNICEGKKKPNGN